MVGKKWDGLVFGLPRRTMGWDGSKVPYLFQDIGFELDHPIPIILPYRPIWDTLTHIFVATDLVEIKLVEDISKFHEHLADILSPSPRLWLCLLIYQIVYYLVFAYRRNGNWILSPGFSWSRIL